MFSKIKTITMANETSNGKAYIEAACLSTDTKPTDSIANGSTCIEIDTGKIFMFDESGDAWTELQ